MSFEGAVRCWRVGKVDVGPPDATESSGSWKSGVGHTDRRPIDVLRKYQTLLNNRRGTVEL